MSRQLAQRFLPASMVMAQLTEANLYKHTVQSPPTREAKLNHILAYVDLQRELVALGQDDGDRDLSHRHSSQLLAFDEDLLLHTEGQDFDSVHHSQPIQRQQSYDHYQQPQHQQYSKQLHQEQDQDSLIDRGNNIIMPPPRRQPLHSSKLQQKTSQSSSSSTMSPDQQRLAQQQQLKSQQQQQTYLHPHQHQQHTISNNIQTHHSLVQTPAPRRELLPPRANTMTLQAAHDRDRDFGPENGMTRQLSYDGLDPAMALPRALPRGFHSTAFEANKSWSRQDSFERPVPQNQYQNSPLLPQQFHQFPLPTQDELEIDRQQQQLHQQYILKQLLQTEQDDLAQEKRRLEKLEAKKEKPTRSSRFLRFSLSTNKNSASKASAKDRRQSHQLPPQEAPPMRSTQSAHVWAPASPLSSPVAEDPDSQAMADRLHSLTLTNRSGQERNSIGSNKSSPSRVKKLFQTMFRKTPSADNIKDKDVAAPSARIVEQNYQQERSIQNQYPSPHHSSSQDQFPRENNNSNINGNNTYHHPHQRSQPSADPFYTSYPSPTHTRTFSQQTLEGAQTESLLDTQDQFPYHQTSLTPPPVSSVLRHSISSSRIFDREPMIEIAGMYQPHSPTSSPEHDLVGASSTPAFNRVKSPMTSQQIQPLQHSAPAHQLASLPVHPQAPVAPTRHKTRPSSQLMPIPKELQQQFWQQQQEHYNYSEMSTYDHGPTMVAIAQVQQADLTGLRRSEGMGLLSVATH